jgi:hypothetical protein
VAFNTTSTFLTFCNGTAWGDANSGAASAITPGSTTVGTETNCFLYADGSSVLQCTNSFIDNTTWIVGGTTPTKRARFEVDGFTAATDRVFTFPGTTGNDTFMLLGSADVVTGAKTFSTIPRFPSGAAALPSIIDSAGLTSGMWWRASSVTVDWSVAGLHALELYSNAGLFLAMGSGGVMGFSSSAAPAGGFDAGFARVTSAVVKPVGATASNIGWIQQWAGELALNANYTNATASFTNTALSANLAAGRTYSFTLVAFFDDSTAADGAQFDFNGGAAAATNFRAHCTAANATGAALVLTNANTTALATAVQVALSLTTQAVLTCNGTIVPTGAGTFIIRAAQTSHSTGTLTIDRGSWLNIRDANPL